MKKILFAIAFFSSLVGGIASTNSVDIRGKIDAYVHQDCERWDSIYWEEYQLFTLNEAKALLNKRIVAKNSKFAKTHIIVDYQMIRKDKFAVSVYYGKDSTGNDIRLLKFDKNLLENYFEILD